jgi:hypothetical protein
MAVTIHYILKGAISSAELIQQLVYLLKDKLTDGTIAEALDIAAEIEEDQMYGHGGEGGIMMEKQKNEEKLEQLQVQENTIQELQKEAIATAETQNCQQTAVGQDEPKCFTDYCKEMISQMVESF